jgi:hypothetical protein
MRMREKQIEDFETRLERIYDKNQGFSAFLSYVVIKTKKRRGLKNYTRIWILALSNQWMKLGVLILNIQEFIHMYMYGVCIYTYTDKYVYRGHMKQGCRWTRWCKYSDLFISTNHS